MTLSRSSVEPFLQFSGRRELREKAFRAWIARGDNDSKTNNNPVIAELTALRDEGQIDAKVCAEAIRRYAIATEQPASWAC